ncbi:MAG: hypothetical protein QXG97_00560 [Nitrososphaerota archaeon]
MFVILDDAGRYSSLNVWLRSSLEDFKPPEPNLKIQGVNAKRITLALLQPFPARILPVESPGGKGVWLFLAVEVSNKEFEAVRALSKTDLTRRESEELSREPTAKHALKRLAVKKIVT